MGLFSNHSQTSRDKLPWPMVVSSPREYRKFTPSAGIAERLFGTGTVVTLFNQRNFGALHDNVKEAANRGDPRAQYMMAYMFDFGQHLAQSDKSAFDWYCRAARQGLPDAENAVGVMYLQGQGVAVNYLEGAKWISIAAQNGNPDALCTMGSFFQNGAAGFPFDPEQAVEYYLRSVRAGHGAGAFNIGLMCEQSQQFGLAALWYDVAFPLGCNEALGNFQALRFRGLIPKELYQELGLKPMLPHEL